jgi:hypothetical protein
MRSPFPSESDASLFSTNPLTDPTSIDSEPQRRAGYVEAAEFEQVIRPGFRYVLEEAGVMNGKRLWSIYRQRVGAEPGERP